MTRALLSLLLCALVLATGLLTCLVQCSNHHRAAVLAARQRDGEMLAASNAQAEAVVSAHVWGVPDAERALSPHAPGRRAAAREEATP